MAYSIVSYPNPKFTGNQTHTFDADLIADLGTIETDVPALRAIQGSICYVQEDKTLYRLNSSLKFEVMKIV